MAAPALLTIVLDGVTSHAAVQPGQTLLDAAEGAGIHLPAICRQGKCGACMTRLLTGLVQMPPELRLPTKRDRDAGMILACQAIARSPELTIIYD